MSQEIDGAAKQVRERAGAPGAGTGKLHSVERQRSHLLYYSMVVMLILGIGVVVYAFSFEVLGDLFSSRYFNNLVRFSFALMLVALVVYLVTREKKYTRDFDGMVEELETNMEELKQSLEDVSARLEVSRMVAISEDLHEKLENRFPGRKNHWKKVSYYAAETARRMNLDEDYVQLVAKAGELMDIGMMRFGEAFRSDAAELTPWEKEMIRRHPIYSVETLASVRPNWEILPLVRHHHEWWNGMGYPDGLKGEAIPLGSRILHLADAFVAMTSYRAYKGAREAREALAEIEAYSGVQFDPRVVQAFLSFMGPRVYLDADGLPAEGGEGGKRTMPLAGRSAGREAAEAPGKEGGNGSGKLNPLEVEDILRDISA
jgi:hypothetical protein